MIRTAMNPVGTTEPTAVAVNVVDAIVYDRAYVCTDEHATDVVNARLNALIAARDDVFPDH